MQVVSRRRSEVRVPWPRSLAAAREKNHHEDHTDTEGEETEEEEAEESKLSEVRGRAQAEGMCRNP